MEACNSNSTLKNMLNKSGASSAFFIPSLCLSA